MKIKTWPWIKDGHYHVMKPDNFFYEYYVGKNQEYDDDENQLKISNGYYFCVIETLSDEVAFDNTYDKEFNTIEEAKQAAEKWHHEYLMEQFEQ